MRHFGLFPDEPSVNPGPLSALNVGASLAASAMLPLLGQINLLLTGAFGLGPLKADFMAQYQAALNISISFGDPIAMLKAAIAAVLSVTASLSAALALGIPPINLQVSASLALMAALEVKLGGINLLLDLSLGVRLAGINFLAQLRAALSAGPVAMYGWQELPLASLMGEVGGYNWAADGFYPGDPTMGVLLIAKEPSAAAGFSFLFGLPAI